MCGGFVEAAKQRRCDHSCLCCTSAAVMFPPWTQQEELEHMGASSESQPAGSLHITTQICCFLMHDASSQNCLSDEVIIKLIKKKLRMSTLRHTGCQTERMSNEWICLFFAVSFISPCSSNAQCLSSKASSKARNSPVNYYLGHNLKRSHFWSPWFLYSVSNSSKQMTTCLLLVKDNFSSRSYIFIEFAIIPISNN